MRNRRRGRALRSLAALLVGTCLLLATPQSAWAREQEKNLWAQWWKGATHREYKVEIPFIILVSVPAMLIITPIWLVQRGYARLSSEEDDGSK
jgi:hypothetical protein